MAATTRMPDEQYETQFLGFSPSLFMEGAREIISDRLLETLNQLENHLSQIPKDILPPNEVEYGIETLLQETDKNFAKKFKKFEPHVQNVMKVPPHILLPTDAEQAAQSSAVEINILNKEIEALQVQLKTEKCMEATFKMELQDINLTLKEQQKVLAGTLSDSQMTVIEEAKEKLIFMKGNETETQKAVGKLHATTEHLKVDDTTPVEILVTRILKGSDDS